MPLATDPRPPGDVPKSPPKDPVVGSQSRDWRLECGYSADNPQALLISEDKITVFNSRAVIKEGALNRIQLQAALTELQQLVASNATVVPVVSPARLYADIRAEIHRGDIPRSDQVLLINTVFAEWQASFAGFSGRTEEHSQPRIETIHSSKRFEERMYVRTGQVELWALQNYLFTSTPELVRMVEHVTSRLNDEEFMYRASNTDLRTNWYDFRDVEYSIRVLMTNAGFYASSIDPFATFADWAERYLSAIRRGTLFHLPMCDLHFASVEAVLAREGHKVTQAEFPGRAEFYEALCGEEIVFVTPLAHEIAHLHQSGKIFNLWKDVSVPNFRLTTIQMPISTYPNRPHDSWSTTFEHVCDLIDTAFSKSRPSLFMTASGSYGLPLCEYVYSNYGCKTVHYGNYLNSLFGIRQNRSENWESSQRRIENWGVPFSTTARNLDRIEDGCYLLTENAASTP